MIAPNISTQPKISRLLRFWPRINQPAITEIQDSKLRIRRLQCSYFLTDDLQGVATPQDITPAYRIGSQAVRMEEICGCSRISAGSWTDPADQKLDTKKALQPSAFGKIVNHQECAGKEKAHTSTRISPRPMENPSVMQRR